ncbi:MAG TPA: metallophosphoesterase family protein [Planctomycetota bacterium]|nr:metallophosphoesterase family protein [Planctomycetota bacterium]
MIAILSDVHANIEALQAVYDDLNQRGIKRIFFLGDIVGYGPNPAEVLEFIKKCEFCLLGNHDEACLKGPPKTFNAAAARASLWTRKQIDPEQMPRSFLRPGLYQQRKEQWDYLQQLKPVRIVSDIMFVHDTPAQPGSWRYVRSRTEADAGFAKYPALRAFFFGHSHQPGVWFEDSYASAEPGRKFDFKKRVMVNVGSVGQPRDKDPRACYVVLEPDGFRFFRVTYDFTKTQQKILACPELDPSLAERLAKGT